MNIKKVLVVEDVEAVREVLCRTVKELGMEAYAAADGDQAIALLSTFGRFDGILLDINLPDQDGISILKKIRSVDKTARVCMVSGISQKERVIDAMRSGAHNYYTKPVDIKRLLSVLSDLCETSFESPFGCAITDINATIVNAPFKLDIQVRLMSEVGIQISSKVPIFKGVCFEILSAFLAMYFDLSDPVLIKAVNCKRVGSSFVTDCVPIGFDEHTLTKIRQIVLKGRPIIDPSTRNRRRVIPA